MEKPNECQLPCLPTLSEGRAPMPPQPLLQTIKRLLAKPWNYHFKKLAKKLLPSRPNSAAGLAASTGRPALQAGNWVRVRSRPEIVATLDRWNELKGCAFLEKMWPYCGTTQRVLQPMERFLDERDYQVKKCRGLVTLENVICRGTPVFGRCDRCCHFFWREEWLEKIEPSSAGEGEAAS